ncbi:MAG: EF-P lysine aminoacylase GenX [Myxococcales bacterium]|nr:EF-P lysine aminoacylase GenX [Myxococcales bacterium]
MGDGERERLGPGRALNLRRRATAMAGLRRFFDQRGFLEVETPLLVPSPGLELHLDAFPVPDASGQRYLITSPEYQMKRLLAARGEGMERIFQVCKCFRRGEAGAHHNPEFTMVEWYRSPGAWEEVARDVEALCCEVVKAVRGKGGPIEYQGRTLDLTPPWQWLSVAEAMERFAGVTVRGDEPAEVLAERGRAAGFAIPPTRTAWDDVFFSIFLDAVDPQLARGGPTILHSWPAPLSALARLDGEGFAERFEAYAGGLELANGYGELTDAAEQRRRCEAERAERLRRELPAYPLDERFLAALAEGIPPSGGVALGIDRLMMLACDAASLREVVSFTSAEV